MFKSLTSFIFGTYSSETDNQDQPVQEQQQQPPLEVSKKKPQQPLESENTIIVTACSSSVTGGGEVVSNNNLILPRRGKNKGNNNRSNKRKVREQKLPTLPLAQQSLQQQQQQQQEQQHQKDHKKALPSKTNISTSSNDLNEDLDEEDWFIVEREDERSDLPFSDFDEEPYVIEVKPSSAEEATTSLTVSTSSPSYDSTPSKGGAAAASAQRRRQQLIGTHSLYSGPRPQQQRNYLQRSRNGRLLSLSASSPPRSAAASGCSGAANSSSDVGRVEGAQSVSTIAVPASSFADERGGSGVGVTQSLYTVTPAIIGGNGHGHGHGNGNGSNAMEESWFVTPPPCFTSIGPIHMETSPYEDLLIEHPSMSVYFSIRSAQEESFINLDLGLKDTQKHDEEQGKKKKRRPLRQKQLPQQQQQPQQQQPELAADEKKSAVMPRRAAAARMDRYSAAQLKQELLARSNQKSFEKQDRRHMVCRSAIKRANKARDYQSKANCQRRADLQHFRVVSGANNNRKCCF